MAQPLRKKTGIRSKRRRYPVHRVKNFHCYDVAEISALFNLHRNTVRHWVKEGLSPIDQSRPLLVHGSMLKLFLAARQTAKAQKCALDEFFCLRCRVPRKPWGGLIDVKPQTDKVARATALCGHCETVMHRTFRCSDVPSVQNLLRVLQLPRERLNDCPLASSNSDLERT